MMQLRGPDMMPHHSLLMFDPHRFFFCLFQAIDAAGFSDHDPVIFRYGGNQIIGAVLRLPYPWVGPLFRDGIVIGGDLGVSPDQAHHRDDEE